MGQFGSSAISHPESAVSSVSGGRRQVRVPPGDDQLLMEETVDSGYEIGSSVALPLFTTFNYHFLPLIFPLNPWLGPFPQTSPQQQA